MAPAQTILASLAVMLAAISGVLPAQTAPVQKLAPQAPGISIQLVQSPALSGRPILPPSSLQPLLDFKDSDVKFSMQTLMNTLRDNRHEGWVLAAYPDPKTSRPLIGAGFSLDLAAREHPQRDPLNSVQFLEPSSAELWQAAGLKPERLEAMLEQYDLQLSAWKKKKFRRKIRTNDLFPQISEDDGMKLLRIYSIQAIHNARAYCRYFDDLNGPQQMALTQLVYQMGVNLEEFTQFLFAINNGPGNVTGARTTNVVAASSGNNAGGAPAASGVTTASLATQSFTAPTIAPVGASGTDYWKSVQETLIHSDWARRYSTRAIAVIAMFDPRYEDAPWIAESEVRAEVHPLHKHRRRAAAVHTASASSHKSSAHRTHKS